MNLINEEITHKVFGVGNIIEHTESVITVDFKDEVKKFVFPDAFEKFIKLNDRNIAKSLQKIIAKQIKEREEAERKLEEEKAKLALEQQLREKIKNLNIHESSQIVFWLSEEEEQNVFTEWNVSTGNVQNGINKGQPNKVARLRPNSAAILTVRDSGQSEIERRILGLYMVDETFFGDSNQAGIVPAHAEFKIQLTDQESENMLFWNYYINKNFPHRMTWNSGKFRYFDNVWTAQILKDIIALRTDEDDIKAARRFLEYFCQMNVIDIDNIPSASGALKQ